MVNTYKQVLHDNWLLQSSDKISGSGEELSTKTLDQGWYKATVPSTILATLIANGLYPNAYVGTNLKKIPAAQFSVPWWYVTEFELTEEHLKKQIRLQFNGINYKASVWLNGRVVAIDRELNGAYRIKDFDISKLANNGKNYLAIKVTPPKPGDFSIGFVDWNVAPPDKNMGIFREVSLLFSNEVAIQRPIVESELDSDTLASAELTISTDLINFSDQKVAGVLICETQNQILEKQIEIPANTTITTVLNPSEYPELRINDPKLWWPNTMGIPNLQTATLLFKIKDKISDSQAITYGIRKVEDYLSEDGHKGFKINGKKLLIKGGGWTDDLFLQDTHESLEAQIKYVKHINLNCIRLEGFWGKDSYLYDLCDMHGILMMVGWSCHWEHEQYVGKPIDPQYGGVIEPDEIELIAQSWEEQIIWLRQHPSIFVWNVGSDMVPHPDLELKYIDSFEKYDTTRPYLNSTGGIGSDQGIVTNIEVISEISGSSCVKMLGPYAYTPPVYWFTNEHLGGAYGFNTETCPGANVPPLASLKKMLPPENHWPIDAVWEYHCGSNTFSTLDRITEALEKRYGKATGIEDYAFKSQVLNYELMRPMFEAFIANQPQSTGIIQWMLNSALPQMYWQLYDTYLQPNGAFYGTKKACNTVHAMYRYGKNDIWIRNNELTRIDNFRVTVRFFDLESNEVFSKEWIGSIEENTSQKIIELPQVAFSTDVHFLDIRVYNEDRIEIESNFYWLAKQEDVLDYEAGKELEWEYHTPSKQYADFTALNNIPNITLETSVEYIKNGEEGLINLRVKNPSDSVAFFVYFDMLCSITNEPILPVFWDDNYVSLLPGEERNYSARFNSKDADHRIPKLEMQGWNLKKQQVSIIPK